MDSASFVLMKYINYLLVISTVILSSFLFTGASVKDNEEKQQIEVVMRTIGHEVMLAHGDSISRILPVDKQGDQYFIQFDTEFVFQASKLINAIDKVVKQTDLVKNYLVEMRECHSNNIIYSYQVIEEIDHNTIPCGLREQPKTCYILQILILDEVQDNISPQKSTESPNLLSATFTRFNNYIFLSLAILLLMGMGLYSYKKDSKPLNDSTVIEIGNYLFDPRKMTLSLANKSIELSGKESDLLSFLCMSVNTTVEREIILRNVWGDQGDYVGRTLDVFISKLRKKLEDDPGVKITNIRGVGYRLVVKGVK